MYGVESYNLIIQLMQMKYRLHGTSCLVYYVFCVLNNSTIAVIAIEISYDWFPGHKVIDLGGLVSNTKVHLAVHIYCLHV